MDLKEKCEQSSKPSGDKFYECFFRDADCVITEIFASVVIDKNLNWHKITLEEITEYANEVAKKRGWHLVGIKTRHRQLQPYPSSSKDSSEEGEYRRGDGRSIEELSIFSGTVFG